MTDGIGFMALLEMRSGRLVAVGPPMDLERAACDHAQRLAQGGYGRYRGAVAFVAPTWVGAIEREFGDQLRSEDERGRDEQ